MYIRIYSRLKFNINHVLVRIDVCTTMIFLSLNQNSSYVASYMGTLQKPNTRLNLGWQVESPLLTNSQPLYVLAKSLN